jgi:TetR/AcrR family transcriptional regulator
MKSPATPVKPRRPGPVPKAGAVLEPVRDAERTKQAILDAAKVEFAEKGLAGARVDAIAEQSGANKRMLYYYFGSKEDLYIAVLEDVYGAMRRTESELDVTHLEPVEGLRRLIEFKFDYYLENPIVIRILAGENLQDARFLKRSKRLRQMHISVVESLDAVLTAGRKAGLMRSGVDPVQLYISIAGLSYFYFANSATLSAAFDRTLMSSPELKKRRAHVVEVILGYVRS